MDSALAQAERLVFTTLPWDGGRRFASPRPYLERLRQHAERLGIAWPEDLPHSAQAALELALEAPPRCEQPAPPAAPGLLRVELTRAGAVKVALRALPPRSWGDDWKAISCAAPFFGRLTGTKHGDWSAYAEATAYARSSGTDVALLVHDGILVDGDRCTPLVRLANSDEVLVPSEARAVHSVTLELLEPRLASFRLRQADIRLDQLWDAEEVVVVGSGVGVQPLTCLDGRRLGAGRRLAAAAKAALEDVRQSGWRDVADVAAAAVVPSLRCWPAPAEDGFLPGLAAALRSRGLWGAGSGWAPDQLLLHSGGPVTDVAGASLLAGPPSLRFTALQPEDAPARPPASRADALCGRLDLLRPDERLPLRFRAERWCGRWEALPTEAPAPRSLGAALRQVASEAAFLEPESLLRPEQALEDMDEDSPVRGSTLAGLLGYDLVQWTQPLALEHPPEAGELLGVLYRVDRWLVHHRSTGRLRLLAPPGDSWAAAVGRLLNQTDPAHFELPGDGQKDEELLESDCQSSIDDQTHMQVVEQVQEAIRQGLLYQLNFGRTWRGPLREAPWELMQKLFRQNAAPYSGFLQLEVEGRTEALCSCSPEQLLALRKGQLSTCPIKGTIGRDADAAKDDALRREMVASQKEVAEHLMLVDLERHDLGYACSPCSVAWERWRVETFPNVQHMVSKVSGKLLPDCDVWSALEALFPGGSITGCPKTPCIAAIDALEGSPRRSWTGSLGFADVWTGDGQWNILIRTVEASKEGSEPWRATIKAGGGLTIGSDPLGEVEEAKLKAKRLLDVAFGVGARSVSSSRGQASAGSRCEAVAHRCIDPFNPRIAALLGAFREGRLRRHRGNPYGRWFLWQPGQALPPLGPTRVLFVDNLDSFSLNVANALAELGADVVVVPGRGPLSPTLEEALAIVSPSHVVLGPGPGRPEVSPLTLSLASSALRGELRRPLLGVCLGHQALGHVEGWPLHQSPLGAVHGVAEEILHSRCGLFAKLESPARMIRYNSLVLQPPSSPKSSQLRVSAWDATQTLVMAVQHRSLPVYGVQFHPESAGSYRGFELLRAFLPGGADARL